MCYNETVRHIIAYIFKDKEYNVMKKIMIMILAVLFVICALSFIGCKKENNPSALQPSPNANIMKKEAPVDKDSVSEEPTAPADETKDSDPEVPAVPTK